MGLLASQLTFLVKNSEDPDVARFVLANLLSRESDTECGDMVNPVRTEAMRSLVQLSYLNKVSGPEAPLLRQYYELGKHYAQGKFSPADQTRALWDQVLSRQKESVQKLQKQLFTQQLQNLVKQQLKQQQEMAAIWRDLMKIENETLIRKMNDPNPMVCLLAIQVAGKKRLPVEKEAIGLLSSANPLIRQAARQTLIRLGRGVDFGPDASASPPQIFASVQSWSSWLDFQGNADEKENDTPLYAGEKTVKVFILAGQSNMEGKAPNALLEYQAKDPKTRDLFAHLRKDNKWIERDDVFVKFLDRRGPLTIGFGSPGRTGVELEFGTLMGNHFEEPVILIKTAWGGHSLYKNFRSPSAGYPADKVLQKELDQMQANVKKSNEKNKKKAPLPTMDDLKSQYGTSYRKMIEEVRDVMDNYPTLFPALKGEKKVEVAGFVWFQGWNDQYGAEEEYASNMKHFINDVRKDLGTPKLPFVIGVMGQNGSKPASGAMLTIQKAQLSMNDIPEFKGNVKAIRTDVLVDKAAEELYPTWRQNPEQWNKVGGDFAYHYLGSAIWFNRIGKAMGESMLELLKNQKECE